MHTQAQWVYLQLLHPKIWETEKEEKRLWESDIRKSVRLCFLVIFEDTPTDSPAWLLKLDMIKYDYGHVCMDMGDAYEASPWQKLQVPK